LGNQYWGGLLEPTSSMPVVIYKYAISPFDELHQLAWAAGLVLIGMVLTANILARLVLARGVSVPRG
jgi:phosphate transport system permease protein